MKERCEVPTGASTKRIISRLRWLFSLTLILGSSILYMHGTRLFAQQGAETSSAPASTFDVVSIRPTDHSVRGFSIKPNPDSFRVTGATLNLLLREAYNLHDFQIEGIPNQLASERFDIEAKMDPASAPASSLTRDARSSLLQKRLQALLADRFQMRVHMENKQMSAFALVVAKGGPKLEAGTANTGYSSGPGRFKCGHTTMEDLSSMLSDVLDRVVQDQTKLSGAYAFTLNWKPERVPNANPDAPELFTAIEEQLGLKIVPARVPTDILTVDHVEMPSGN